IKPTFVATQVYAGLAVENLATSRVTGTVASRSGNTLNIHGAELLTRDLTLVGGVQVSFSNNISVTVGAQTGVSLDGQPEIANPSTQLISVGQHVNIEGTAQITNNSFSGIDATAGLVRLPPTTAWGTLNAGAQAGSATIDLISLGGYQPEALTFTGT